MSAEKLVALSNERFVALRRFLSSSGLPDRLATSGRAAHSSSSRGGEGSAFSSRVWADICDDGLSAGGTALVQLLHSRLRGSKEFLVDDLLHVSEWLRGSIRATDDSLQQLAGGSGRDCSLWSPASPPQLALLEARASGMLCTCGALLRRAWTASKQVCDKYRSRGSSDGVNTFGTGSGYNNKAIAGSCRRIQDLLDGAAGDAYANLSNALWEFSSPAQLRRVHEQLCSRLNAAQKLLDMMAAEKARIEVDFQQQESQLSTFRDVTADAEVDERLRVLLASRREYEMGHVTRAGVCEQVRAAASNELQAALDVLDVQCVLARAKALRLIASQSNSGVQSTLQALSELVHTHASESDAAAGVSAGSVADDVQGLLVGSGGASTSAANSSSAHTRTPFAVQLWAAYQRVGGSSAAPDVAVGELWGGFGNPVAGGGASSVTPTTFPSTPLDLLNLLPVAPSVGFRAVDAHAHTHASSLSARLAATCASLCETSAAAGLVLSFTLCVASLPCACPSVDADSTPIAAALDACAFACASPLALPARVVTTLACCAVLDCVAFPALGKLACRPPPSARTRGAAAAAVPVAAAAIQAPSAVPLRAWLLRLCAAVQSVHAAGGAPDAVASVGVLADAPVAAAAVAVLLEDGLIAQRLSQVLDTAAAAAAAAVPGPAGYVPPHGPTSALLCLKAQLPEWRAATPSAGVVALRAMLSCGQWCGAFHVSRLLAHTRHGAVLHSFFAAVIAHKPWWRHLVGLPLSAYERFVFERAALTALSLQVQVRAARQVGHAHPPSTPAPGSGVGELLALSRVVGLTPYYAPLPLLVDDSPETSPATIAFMTRSPQECKKVLSDGSDDPAALSALLQYHDTLFPVARSLLPACDEGEEAPTNAASTEDGEVDMGAGVGAGAGAGSVDSFGLPQLSFARAVPEGLALRLAGWRVRVSRPRSSLDADDSALVTGDAAGADAGAVGGVGGDASMDMDVSVYRPYLGAAGAGAAMRGEGTGAPGHESMGEDEDFATVQDPFASQWLLGYGPTPGGVAAPGTPARTPAHTPAQAHAHAQVHAQAQAHAQVHAHAQAQVHASPWQSPLMPRASTGAGTPAHTLQHTLTHTPHRFGLLPSARTPTPARALVSASANAPPSTPFGATPGGLGRPSATPTRTPAQALLQARTPAWPRSQAQTRTPVAGYDTAQGVLPPRTPFTQPRQASGAFAVPSPFGASGLPLTATALNLARTPLPGSAARPVSSAHTPSREFSSHHLPPALLFHHLQTPPRHVFRRFGVMNTLGTSAGAGAGAGAGTGAVQPTAKGGTFRSVVGAGAGAGTAVGGGAAAGVGSVSGAGAGAVARVVFGTVGAGAGAGAGPVANAPYSHRPSGSFMSDAGHPSPLFGLAPPSPIALSSHTPTHEQAMPQFGAAAALPVPAPVPASAPLPPAFRMPPNPTRYGYARPQV